MRRTKLLIISLWILALLSVAAYFYRSERPAEPPVQIVVTQPVAKEEGVLPVLFLAPAFSLTDQRGRTFSSEELKGKIWVAFIFLTNCPTGACPVMIGKMAKLQEALPDERVHFVSFSIDPQRDTPEVLARYANEIGGAEVSERWHLLTGQSAAQMKQFAADFKLAVGEDWGHSTIFLLVDAKGNVRASVGNDDPEGMAKLRAATEALLAERQ